MLNRNQVAGLLAAVVFVVGLIPVWDDGGDWRWIATALLVGLALHALAVSLPPRIRR